ncbi:uncharacterized protein RAG0_12538 [Rhynchosporium agropyri]|uniref:Uncharacterized protein n=1 Tax=Rhynchosporium agropyri TaxID=914238 RepID=A0A1E1L8W6_9HELO|nr:uncharacterized protein RAG0_12538 [Rhynchosporium agropyri]
MAYSCLNVCTMLRIGPNYETHAKAARKLPSLGSSIEGLVLRRPEAQSHKKGEAPAPQYLTTLSIVQLRRSSCLSSLGADCLGAPTKQQGSLSEGFDWAGIIPTAAAEACSSLQYFKS